MINNKLVKINGGFSLIVTITILVLLSLIAVGLLSLSSTVLRSSQSEQSMLQARANARLALQLAIGELQKNLGPDTRVSATAEILEGKQSVSPEMRNVTGVWNSWKIDPRRARDYEDKKKGSPSNGQNGSGQLQPEGGFYRWLISSNDDDVESIGFVRGQGGQDTVPLVSAVTGTDSGLKAPRVLIGDGAKSSGSYAWAVLDEGVKANISRAQDPSSAPYSLAEKALIQSELAWNHVDEWSALGDIDDEESAKLVSRETVELVALDNAEEYFNDLTVFSSGVISDTANGGLKKDLSLLFKDQVLPADFTNDRKYIYSDDSTAPIVGSVARGSHPFQFPTPDPTWKLLHQFHRIPVDLFNSAGSDARIEFVTST